MKTHELKTWPEFYEKLVSGEKNFELRYNDRGFVTGDTLHLREFNPDTQEYTGRSCLRKVTSVIKRERGFGLTYGFCIMSLAFISND